MDDVVAPLLHNYVSVNPVAVNTEFPQLLTTFTLGADGVVFGAAVVLIVALVQPFTVSDTPNVPVVVTVIDGVVAPLLHNKVPVNPEAVSTELPQLFTIDKPGAGGIDLGAAVPPAAGLVHPPIVWVTV